MESSYDRLGHINRVVNMISGGTMGAYVKTLQGMMLQHQQRERSDSGEIYVVWFVNSHLHNAINK